MKTLLILMLVFLMSCTQKQIDKNEQVMTLKLTFSDGKTDTIKVKGNRYTLDHNNEMYEDLRYSYLIVDGQTVAYDVASVSLIDHHTCGQTSTKSTQK